MQWYQSSCGISTIFPYTKLVRPVVVGTSALLQYQACLSLAQRNVSFLKLCSQAKLQAVFLTVCFIGGKKNTLYFFNFTSLHRSWIRDAFDIMGSFIFLKYFSCSWRSWRYFWVGKTERYRKLFCCAFWVYSCGVLQSTYQDAVFFPSLLRAFFSINQMYDRWSFF